MKTQARIESVGAEWMIEMIDAMPMHIERISPVEFNEQNRYLPAGTTPRPGFISYDLFPFLKEIIDCFDIMSPVREVNLMKGSQVGYTTLLESVLLYYIAQVKTEPCMFITADKELATGRLENNIIPMINASNFEDLIQSSDEGNAKKTGKTRDYLQWSGGGKLFLAGANNPAKMREKSVSVMLKDELDGWKYSVGKDGNPDDLTNDRLKAFWSQRKILRGSTPLIYPSMINDAYDQGDKRKYMVCCRKCNHPQEIRQQSINSETGVIGGFIWDMQDGRLIHDSVRWCCSECGHEHYESDKDYLFSEDNGAHWQPTAEAKQPNVRSYHLPSFYSPFGFTPWYKCIEDYIQSWDKETKTVKSKLKLQKYYNNILGVPFRELGSKIRFTSVSAHRRAIYRLGDVPNNYANKHSGSKILFLTCQVDVHKRNLAVSVMGWTSYSCCYLIDYWRFEHGENNDYDCTERSSSVWYRLRELIESKVYIGDDGTKYNILLTLIDSGYANDTVIRFCGDYESGVYPIIGREKTAKAQTIKEFSEFKTQLQTTGYRILVDYYKDRIAPVLRREWIEEAGTQKTYHFNAPVDTSDAQLKELTTETRKEKVDDRGNTSFIWHRSGNVANELWDLLVYGHAAMEIIAYKICIQHFGLNTVDWLDFWKFAQSSENCGLFGRVDL